MSDSIVVENVKLEADKAEGVVLKFMITKFINRELDTIDKAMLKHSFNDFIMVLFEYGRMRGYWKDQDVLDFNNQTDKTLS